MFTFIETSYFTEDIKQLITDDSYAELQHELATDPELGSVIRGSGGARKLRWNLENTGKSSGIRVIYYFYDSLGRIYMLYVYPKSEKEDLSQREIQLLKRFVMELKR